MTFLLLWLWEITRIYFLSESFLKSFVKICKFWFSHQAGTRNMWPRVTRTQSQVRVKSTDARLLASHGPLGPSWCAITRYIFQIQMFHPLIRAWWCWIQTLASHYLLLARRDIIIFITVIVTNSLRSLCWHQTMGSAICNWIVGLETIARVLLARPIRFLGFPVWAMSLVLQNYPGLYWTVILVTTAHWMVHCHCLQN